MFACTHCPRRTASTCATSEGASRPVNPATWSSATRTASSNPRRSSSLGAGSSVPHDAEAMPTCRASSQFTGPLEDNSTRWISRNSGTSFQISPGGAPNGFLGRRAHAAILRRPRVAPFPHPSGGLAPRRRACSLRWAGAARTCSCASPPTRSAPRMRSPSWPTMPPAARASSSGTVRDHSEAGDVTGLAYEAWEEQAVRRLTSSATSCSSAGRSARSPSCIGRASSAWARCPSSSRVRSPHRAEAFEACRHGIEQLKHDVPIWKKEHLTSGESSWVMGS